MPDKPNPLISDAAIFLRGLCMGCADVVPGVSGGTVALILGIYERLVTAISRFDMGLLRQLGQGRWRESIEYVDFRFLAILATGLGTGVIGMTLLMNRLLNDAVTRSLTLAAFFGMILASAFVVASLIRPASTRLAIRCLALGVLAAALAAWLTTLQAASGSESNPSHGYLFVCGCVAICAMILPGISGAMILLVLGVYVHLTEVPRNLLAGEEVYLSLTTIAVFGSGCVVSLILFSKVLKWLLLKHYAMTMSVLCGFMFGALPKLWPFQRDLTPEIEKFKHKRFELVWPDPVDGQVMLVVGTALLAMVFVLAVDRLGRRDRASE